MKAPPSRAISVARAKRIRALIEHFHCCNVATRVFATVNVPVIASGVATYPAKELSREISNYRICVLYDLFRQETGLDEVYKVGDHTIIRLMQQLEHFLYPGFRGRVEFPESKKALAHWISVEVLRKWG